MNLGPEITTERIDDILLLIEIKSKNQDGGSELFWRTAQDLCTPRVSPQGRVTPRGPAGAGVRVMGGNAAADQDGILHDAMIAVYSQPLGIPVADLPARPWRRLLPPRV